MGAGGPCVPPCVPLRSAYVPLVENFGVIFWTFGVFLIKPQGEEQRAGPRAEQEQKEQEEENDPHAPQVGRAAVALLEHLIKADHNDS